MRPLYVYVNGERRGPFTEEAIAAHLAAGLLRLHDLASDQAEGQLQPLSAFVASQPPPIEHVASSPPPVLLSDLPRLPVGMLGPYARATLAPNETPFYRTSLHWIVFARFAFLGLIAFLFVAIPFAIAVQALTGSQLGWFALPLPAFILLTPTLAYVGSELVITDMRVLIKTGIIRRQTLETFISRIESIAIDQGLFGRLFDYGTVVVRGTGGFEERFDAIAHPLEFRNWVQRMQKGGELVRTTASPAT